MRWLDLPGTSPRKFSLAERRVYPASIFLDGRSVVSERSVKGLLRLKRQLPRDSVCGPFPARSAPGPGKDTYGPRTDIAGMQGRVLASAELGNGPGVDACTALHSAGAGIGATLSTNF
jgi:hypothetical protein